MQKIYNVFLDAHHIWRHDSQVKRWGHKSVNHWKDKSVLQGKEEKIGKLNFHIELRARGRGGVWDGQSPRHPSRSSRTGCYGEHRPTACVHSESGSNSCSFTQDSEFSIYNPAPWAELDTRSWTVRFVHTQCQKPLQRLLLSVPLNKNRVFFIYSHQVNDGLHNSI